ncbi:cytochrome C [Roseibium sp. TrichSKD4]|uniref:cytochrome c552 n=1 Tax=Roseibium sp. TrichSKD4 TaxID=744980 RepID=UPI0001E56CBC|nr:cytochrome c552 [Roseibium sp. TrichSKD4]EFO32706.1 cytochrome C [Roseibium sp. TrichSKD4]
MNSLRPIAAMCLTLLAGSLFQPHTALAADSNNGKKLALQWCAECHLIAEDQAVVSGASLPSFYDLAKDGSWSEDKLKTFLMDPHPKMPNLNLTTFETGDLARYISSLK